MVMTVLWAELWTVVARCNLAGNVGILQQNYFDKLDTRKKKEGHFGCLHCVFYGTTNELEGFRQIGSFIVVSEQLIVCVR